MRVSKSVINMSSGAHIPCCWDDCRRDGVELHKARVRERTEHGPGVAHYVFCSERHKMFWVNSHRDNGNLPAGYRLSVS